jgi:hypothetical protein
VRDIYWVVGRVGGGGGVVGRLVVGPMGGGVGCVGVVRVW